MSIKVMTAVWEHSEAKGANLLLLLAIADHASDDGLAWPSIETLAKKIRMSDRHTRRIISELAASGEIYIDRGANYNRYVILVDQAPDRIYQTLRERLEMSHEAVIHAMELIALGGQDVRVDDDDRGTTCQGTRTHVSAHEDIAMSSESSLTVMEPSEREDDDEEEERQPALFDPVASRPDPVEEVFHLYEHEIGPLSPMVVEDIEDLFRTECQDLDRWRYAFQESVGASYRWKYIKQVILHPEKKREVRSGNTRTGQYSGAGRRRTSTPARFSTASEEEIAELNRAAEERERLRAAAASGS